MSKALLILGNQLFPLKYYKSLNIKNAFMAEDLGLCTHYKYHKHKIVLFLSAMRQYGQEIKNSTSIDLKYYNFKHNLFKSPFEIKLKNFIKEKNITQLVSYEIEDQFFQQRIDNFCKSESINIEYLESPMFLTKRNEFKEYLSSNKKPFMKTFYQRQRKRLNIMIDVNGKPSGGQWSFDSDNRKKLAKNITPPILPETIKNKYVVEVSSFVDEFFSDHPGECFNFFLPTNRKECLSWLDNFIKYRLSLFGTYQDAITKKSDFVFHSVISPMINMGLILPDEIIQKIITAHEQDPDNIPINSVEGFIRQVIGWREFVRGIYQNYGKNQWSTNFWKHNRKLKNSWYTGETGLEILDDTINKANKYAYNHHIERLMIVSNLMLLCEIHPHQVYKWFMEMNADSSDWVMGPNVFGMGQFSDGGIFATKPYICGSNYYVKMSDYKKGEWCHIVDGLYWRFIEKHKEFYKKNPRMSMMVKNLEKISSDRKKKIFDAAELFIENTTMN